MKALTCIKHNLLLKGSHKPTEYRNRLSKSFVPGAKLNTVRFLLSLAMNLDWSLYQLDVKNALFSGDLEEKVYMHFPRGLENKSNSHLVCKPRKSLYGLKQSLRAWFHRFAK